MSTTGIIALIIGGALIVAGAAVGIAALVTHSHATSAPVVQVHNNNRVNASAPASPAAPAAPAPAGPAAVPATGYFSNANNLATSIAHEQSAAQTAAPAYDYDSPAGTTASITVVPDGGNQYTAYGTDSDGNTASGDIVTVAPGGSSWSDTGMNWSGPDVDINGWTTPAVSGYAGS